MEKTLGSELAGSGLPSGSRGLQRFSPDSGRQLTPSIFVIGHVVENSDSSPARAVGFSLMTLNIYDEGQAYTGQEYLDLLTEPGLEDGNTTSMSGGLTLVSAKNPV